MSKNIALSKMYKNLLALLILVVGFFIGYIASTLTQPKQPTAQEIEQTKNDIARLYTGKTVAACWTVDNGSTLGVGKYELNYRTMRINKKLNRAIVTDCGENDTLLFKNKLGQWIRTNVNLQIGNRVNPAWQKACGIEDITVADDRIRPENSSIDEMNLQECKQIDRQ